MACSGGALSVVRMIEAATSAAFDGRALVVRPKGGGPQESALTCFVWGGETDLALATA